LASDAKVFVDAHPVLPLQAALRLVVFPVVVAAAVDVLPVVPE
jgi:hypothetical protein